MKEEKLNILKNYWKVIYLILLIAISFIYLLCRWSFIIEDNASIIDISIVIVFISLVLSPLFSEIKLFGFSFKTEIKELKADLKNEIVNLRSEISNSISFNPNISLNSSSLSKEDVDELLIKYNNHNIENTNNELLGKSIPKEVKELFDIRYVLENKLNEVSKKIRSQYEDLNESFRPPTRVILYLQEDRVINEKLGNAIKYVYNTTSRAIHGENIHEMTIENVKELAPVLIKELDYIIKNKYP